MKKLTTFLFLLSMVAGLSAQTFSGTEDEILIWNGPGPGSEALTIEQNIINRTVAGECLDNRAVEDVVETSIVPFISENPSGAAVVICPGGGYSRVVMDKEGSDIAMWLNEIGISAFIVKYRMPVDDHVNKEYVSLQDGQRAMRYVRTHAEHWGIDPDMIGIMGFSAGGHMASMVAKAYDKEVYTPIDTVDNRSAKPNFMMLIYPVVSMENGVTHDATRYNLLGGSPTADQIIEFSGERGVNSDSPITFMARAKDDTSVPEANCTRLRDSLTAAGVSNVLFQYKNGGHGAGKCEAVGTDFYNWYYDCGKWLKANGLTHPDLAMPVSPSGLILTDTLFDRVSLEWTNNDPAFEGHMILLDGVRNRTTKNNTATVTGLKAETAYTIGLYTYNLIGNSDTLEVDFTTPVEVGVGRNTADGFSLTPNPVSSLDELVFSIPATGFATISIYDLSGKILDVKELNNASPGRYSFDFDVRDDLNGYVIVDLNMEGSSYTSLIQLAD